MPAAGSRLRRFYESYRDELAVRLGEPGWRFSGDEPMVITAFRVPSEKVGSLETLHEEIRRHGGCGFEPCETATQMVPGEGSPEAEVMLVGEAPGASEDEQGRPFVGRSGRLLDELLGVAGLDRAAVYITNVVKARPPHNRDPRADEVAHWLPWLDRQLALVQPRLVIPLGRHALAHFDTRAKIGQVHGRLIADRRPALVPWYHPAAGLRSTALREALFADARALPAALARVRSG